MSFSDWIHIREGRRRDERSAKLGEMKKQKLLTEFHALSAKKQAEGRRMFNEIYKTGILWVGAYGTDDNNDLIAYYMLRAAGRLDSSRKVAA